MHIEPGGHERFPQLVPYRPLMPEETYLYELLSDRAASLDDPASSEIPTERSEDSLRIEAPMAVEASVLDADDGLHQIIGKILSCGLGHLERTYAPERLAIRGFEQERRLGATNGFLSRKVVERPNHRAYRRRSAENRDKGDPLGDPPNGTRERAAARRYRVSGWRNRRTSFGPCGQPATEATQQRQKIVRERVEKCPSCDQRPPLSRPRRRILGSRLSAALIAGSGIVGYLRHHVKP
jgi:hypothetical protein